MNKLVKMTFLGLGVMLLMAAPVLAQPGEGTGSEGVAAPASAPLIPNAVGIGLVVIGASLGMGKLASSALESMARQPEIAASIQTAMIIAAALIEGLSFFAIFACWASGLMGG